MKRNLFLIVLISFYTKGQLPIEELVNNVWYLKSVETIDLNPHFDYLENPEFDYVSLTFSIENDILHYRTEVCAVKEGVVTEFFDGGESMIRFEESIISGNECVDPETNAFESSYFGHIFDEEYWSYVTTESDGSLKLLLSSPNFCGASFSNRLLSTEELSENKISIYPNPVKNKLTLNNLDLEITQIKITDASGKMILQQNINSSKTELDFSSFPKGVYILTTESKGTIIKAEKIIKN